LAKITVKMIWSFKWGHMWKGRRRLTLCSCFYSTTPLNIQFFTCIY